MMNPEGELDSGSPSEKNRISYLYLGKHGSRALDINLAEDYNCG